MKTFKRTSFFMLAFFLSFFCAAQSSNSFCGIDVYLESLVASGELEEPNVELSDILTCDPDNYDCGEVLEKYIIPIVFHVIHNPGTAIEVDENISDEQILDAVCELNEDFRKMVNSSGWGEGVDTKIEFRLANRDENGVCFSGINRVAHSYEMIDYTSGAEDLAIKNLSRLNPYKYLNIWVVKEIVDSQGNTGVAAYSTGLSFVGEDRDGIVIEYQYIGRVGSAQTPYHALSHEVGHSLDLRHTYGSNGDPFSDDGCLDGTLGDLVCDTPPTKAPFLVGDCNQGVDRCNDGTMDMITNYMDIEQCKNAFTCGQRDRMIAALVGERSELVSSTNISEVINPLADFDMNDSYCKSEGSFTPVLNPLANPNGTWGISSGGAINPVTGEVDLANSEAGPHQIIYNINDNGCVGSYKSNFSILPSGAAYFELPDFVCHNSDLSGIFLPYVQPYLPASSGQGGVWSILPFGIIDPSSGIFDPTLDPMFPTGNIYEITYQTCGESHTEVIEIISSSNTDIILPLEDYFQDHYCHDEILSIGTDFLIHPHARVEWQLEYGNTVLISGDVLPVDIPLGDYSSIIGNGPVTFEILANWGCSEFKSIFLYVGGGEVALDVEYLEGCVGTIIPDLSFTNTNPPFSYEWSTGENTPEISGILPGFYTLTLTDSYGCTLIGGVDVAEAPTIEPLTILSQPATCNFNGNIWLLNAEGNPISPLDYSFQWSNGATTFPLNAPWGVYTVTVTADNGCTAEYPGEIEYDCSVCDYCPEGYVSINGASGMTVTLAAALGLFPNPADENTPRQLCIQGTLIVDQTTRLVNSDILMAPGAEIVVDLEEDEFFLAASSTIQSCDSIMWKGIHVLGEATFVALETTIRDAEFAINIEPDASVGMTGCNFINNVIGLSANFNTAANFTLLGLWKNEFVSEGVFREPYYGQAVLPVNNRSLAGIQLENILAPIPLSALSFDNPNVFHNIQNGILLNNTSANINYNTFEDILDSSEERAAIRSQGTGQVVNIHNNIFSNCHNNIDVSGNTVSIQNNVMMDMPDEALGVTISMAQNMDIQVNGNEMSGLLQRGIGILDSAPYNTLEVNDNAIEILGNNVATGIAVDEIIPVAPVTSSTINNNSISLKGHQEGISLTMVVKTIVDDNQIQFTTVLDDNDDKDPPGPNGEQGGINLNGTLDCYLRCNVVQGVLGNESTGLYSLSSDGSVISCNDFDGVGIGVEFSGTCTNTNLVANEMLNEMHVGLSMTNSAMFGSAANPMAPTEDEIDAAVQRFRQNRWTGSYNTAGARHGGNDFAVLLSRFIVESSGGGLGSGLMPPSIVTQDVDGWFLEEPSNGALLVCVGCPDNETIPIKLTEIEKELVKGTSLTDVYREELRWEAESKLYKKLTENPSLIDEDLDVNAFYNNIVNSDNEIKLYREVEQHLEEANTLSTQEEQSLGNTAVELKTMMMELESAQLATSAGVPTASEILQIKGEQESIISDYSNSVMERNITLQSIEETAVTYKTAAWGINTIVSVDKYYKDYLRIINSIYLATLAQGISEFSESQVAMIDDIANMCPLEIGAAVFKARSMNAFINPGATYNDESICWEVGIDRSVEDKEKSVNQRLKISPNPSAGKFTIEHDLTHTTKLVLYNNTGKILRTSLLSADIPEMVFDVSELSSGIYFVKVITNTRDIYTEKIVILK